MITQLKQTAPNVQVRFLQTDHASLASVQQSAKLVLKETDRLDLVFCVAGITALPPGLTKDGYEVCLLQYALDMIHVPLHARLTRSSATIRHQPPLPLPLPELTKPDPL